VRPSRHRGIFGQMLEIVVIFVCLLLNGLFAAYEMAFVSVSRPALRALSQAGNSRAKRLLSLRENPERTLSVIQLGITAVGAIAAAIGGAGASDSIEPYFIDQLGFSESSAELAAVIVVVAPITFLSVVVGELVPKSLALRNPIKIALLGSRWIALADRSLSPMVHLLEVSTKLIISVLFRVKDEQTTHGESPTIELDTLTPQHQKYIMNLAQIEQRRIKEIMIPWGQVNTVDSADQYEEINRLILSSGHTRLPVTENKVVIGILHAKEFAAFKEAGNADWKTIIRPAVTIALTDSALKIMRQLQDKRHHMAIVSDQVGQPLGIVTLEDILEEIVGDIYDEDDDGRIRNAIITKTRVKAL
jgi:putative hemolysin